MNGDYSDAIAVSTTLASVPGCVPEGGAKNVARRDGMGTVMLDAAVTTGRIPDHYFQAVGSGTGAIAAWEAAMRLIRDGNYGRHPPPAPPCPERTVHPHGICMGGETARDPSCTRTCRMPGSIGRVMSDVLTNRNPPYGIRGGLYDALVATEGRMYGIPNAAGYGAMKLARDTMGIDLDPAAAIATASLVQAVENDIIGPDDHILLNLTGGGYERIREAFTLHPVRPSATITPGESPEELVRELKEWIGHYG